MYNGVGLPTPRGSGTSGYVQKNLAYVSKTTSKMQFQKELEALKANPPKPPKKPNTEILEHEQKRQIEIQLIGLRAALEKEDNTPEEIEEKVRRVRVHLHSKLAEAPIITQNTSHSKIFQKTEEISRFQTAFNIDKDYVIGSGFDFEAIEEKRVQEQENKRILYEKNKLLAEIKLKQAAAEPAKVVPELELGEIVDSSVNLDIKEDLPKDLQTLKTPNPAKNPTIEREKNEEKKEEIKVDLKHSSEAGEISERSPQRDRSLRKEGNERSQRDKDYSRDRRDQRPHGERDYKYRKDHRDQRDPISRRENADESGKKYSKDQSDRRDRADKPRDKRERVRSRDDRSYKTREDPSIDKDSQRRNETEKHAASPAKVKIPEKDSGPDLSPPVIKKHRKSSSSSSSSSDYSGSSSSRSPSPRKRRHHRSRSPRRTHRRDHRYRSRS